MKKKKVLIVSGSLNMGGAEKVAQSIALYGKSDHFEYHYLVFHQNRGIYEDALLSCGCFIHRLPEPADNYWSFFLDLTRLLNRYEFHVVHAHTMFNCGLIMLCARLCQVPVRISHAHSSLTEKRCTMYRVYETVMRILILRFSTALFACSNQAGIRLYGPIAFSQKGVLIPNGIDIDLFAYEEPSREAVRSALHVKSATILGHVGRLVPVKNQTFLLDLMPQLLQNEPDAVLLLLGDGEEKTTLKEKIRKLGIQDHVILAGSVDNISAYLSAMDVFVFPSLFEGMPLSLLEAQANGLPCVVSDSISHDAFLTDLVCPLSLNAPQSDWIQAILSAKRTDPRKYNLLLQNLDISSAKSVAVMHRFYQKDCPDD